MGTLTPMPTLAFVCSEGEETMVVLASDGAAVLAAMVFLVGGANAEIVESDGLKLLTVVDVPRDSKAWVTTISLSSTEQEGVPK